ncbi:hypothetical protein HDV05_002255 [Chytridiales sp. JEL 0842]|nr:hypothetical protein HDV05_002255 [Chytridiales sp. JEL 0842]
MMPSSAIRMLIRGTLSFNSFVSSVTLTAALDHPNSYSTTTKPHLIPSRLDTADPKSHHYHIHHESSYYIFANRVDAGKRLASHPSITKYTNSPLLAAQGATEQEFTNKSNAATIVLALPRGGTPVAYPIAEALKSPLDLLIVRKLGLPYYEEVAMGAISIGDVAYLNRPFIRQSSVSEADIQKVMRKEKEELRRRNEKYRGGRPPPEVKGKNVIIVDDGIATGATITAAVQAIKTLDPYKVIVAAPVGAPDSVADVSKIADEVVVLSKPPMFQAVGQWYRDFPQTEDDEVLDLLRQAKNFGKA